MRNRFNVSSIISYLTSISANSLTTQSGPYTFGSSTIYTINGIFESEGININVNSVNNSIVSLQFKTPTFKMNINPSDTPYVANVETISLEMQKNGNPFANFTINKPGQTRLYASMTFGTITNLGSKDFMTIQCKDFSLVLNDTIYIRMSIGFVTTLDPATGVSTPGLFPINFIKTYQVISSVTPGQPLNLLAI